jgi:hypothetical protein
MLGYDAVIITKLKLLINTRIEDGEIKGKGNLI